MRNFMILIFTACALFAQDKILNKDEILQKYSNAKPTKWSEDLPGVIRDFKTDKKLVALTLDLCGSKNDSLDERIVGFLEENKLKATFFVNLRWIEKFPKEFARLSQNPNFAIENHGAAHQPASLNGASIYGIAGTANSEQLYAEIAINAEKIEVLTGKRPKFYRSGTAYYDELAILQIYDMGFAPLGFSVLGDAGATMSEDKARAAVSSAKGGDIIIAHANHPEKPSGKGVVQGLQILLENGFEFALLSEVIQ